MPDYKNINNLSQGEREAFFNALNAEASGETIPTGTPVNAVAAAGTITSSNVEVTDGDIVILSGVTYTFKDTLASIGHVKRNGTADTTLGNLRSAITGTGTPGSDYFTGLSANPYVSCSSVAAHVLTLTALTRGTVGNAYTLLATTASAATQQVLSLSGNLLTGGVDGTVAGANALLADSSFLYVAVAAQTVADRNWRRVTLGSAF